MPVPRIYWVSDCHLAVVNVYQPPGSMHSDSPPDPITTCDECGNRCEEWGLTREEYINELKKKGKDPEDYGFEPQEIKDSLRSNQG